MHACRPLMFVCRVDSPEFIFMCTSAFVLPAASAVHHTVCTFLPALTWCDVSFPSYTLQLMGLLVSHILCQDSSCTRVYPTLGYTLARAVFAILQMKLSRLPFYSSYHSSLPPSVLLYFYRFRKLCPTVNQGPSGCSGEAVVPGAHKPSVGEGTESRQLSPLQLLPLTATILPNN